MKLGIYSLKKILFQGEAKELNCKTTSGEITVLDHHRPLITMLAKGKLKVIDHKDKQHEFEVVSGFLEVQPGNSARVIVEE
ncbi:MAG: F0F1 ATP synthase subunit epsilon [Candidatus Paceibacterota bacterium]|jgi:F0F1-type ATP synthase epsilon subunit